MVPHDKLDEVRAKIQEGELTHTSEIAKIVQPQGSNGASGSGSSSSH